MEGCLLRVLESAGMPYKTYVEKIYALQTQNMNVYLF